MRFFVFTAFAAVTASTAVAGNMNEATPAPAPTPVQATPEVADFSGAYAGIGYGVAQGEIGFNGADDDYEFNDGMVVSAFGGYNFQQGNFVYGGEIAFNSISDLYVPGGFGDDDHIESLIDLRARAGYVVGNAMIYGALGYSFGDYVENPGTSATFRMNGPAVGVGADYKISENLFIGADYMLRKLDGNEIDTDQPAASNVSTINLRVGYSF
ncbi:outer membrane protein [Salibaculum griseiflavum]|uniref:Outer membrane protein beta-barrel domain-containing protein n=1 Tax=Salibaculum griseiflavum TaxID=1914409 RepID=A0A2V1P6S2_9RHOB|nr:outer membrane beta-barrel protein [Salibaculum griseiflavum]PWG18201.1 hypothetical protein DFK10_02825 [Salibaculum griseiflavum]